LFLIATLLVPGLNCSARIFAHQIPALWQFGPVMVADHSEGDTIEAIAGNILATAPPSFALVGFSMGGYVALEIVRRAPERVRKLALLATNARADTPEQSEKRLKRVAMVEAGGFEDDIRQQSPMAVHRGNAADPLLASLNRTMALEAGAETFVRHIKAIIARRDQRALLPTISCPTLVVAGDGDQLMPAAVTDELAANIPGARLVTLPRSGHCFPLEQPERLNEALAEWLDR
jgi:pimeloyl-ACP methyl ester carboxylesterase